MPRRLPSCCAGAEQECWSTATGTGYQILQCVPGIGLCEGMCLGEDSREICREDRCFFVLTPWRA